MNKTDLKRFHRRLLINEFRPTDQESAAAMNSFMAEYSQFHELKNRGMGLQAEIKFYDCKPLVREIKRMLRNGQIIEGANNE